MKKCRSVIIGLVLCILIATFLGEIIVHILQKEKIVTKNRPCSRGSYIEYNQVLNIFSITLYLMEKYVVLQYAYYYIWLFMFSLQIRRAIRRLLVSRNFVI